MTKTRKMGGKAGKNGDSTDPNKSFKKDQGCTVVYPIDQLINLGIYNKKTIEPTISKNQLKKLNKLSKH